MQIISIIIFRIFAFKISFFMFALSSYAVNDLFNYLDIKSNTISDVVNYNSENDIFTNVETNTTRQTSEASIIAINKITANSQEISLKLGEKKYFGNAEITLHKCYIIDDKLKPEHIMLVELVDNRFDQEQKLIYKGWIFANNLSLSAVEHSVYQLLLINCGSK